MPVRLCTSAVVLLGLLLCCHHSVLAQTIKRVPGLTGLHWDIEPHTLDQWRSDYTAVATDFLDLLADLKSIQQVNELSLSVDANCNLDSSQCPPSCSLTYRGQTKPVSEHIIDSCDQVNWMDYYTDLNTSFVSAVASEIPYCKETGKECIIAVNLSPNDAQDNTFWFSGLATMSSFMADLWRQYVTTGGYTKLRWAMHTYGYYLQANPSSVSPSAETLRDLYWWCPSALSDYCDIYNATSRASLISFAKAHAVHTVYIDAPAIVNLVPPTGDQALLCNFIRDLDTNGIQSQLIFGAASWSLAANHNIPLGYARNANRMIEYYGDTFNATKPASVSAPSAASGSILMNWCLFICIILSFFL